MAAHTFLSLLNTFLSQNILNISYLIKKKIMPCPLLKLNKQQNITRLHINISILKILKTGNKYFKVINIKI